MTNQPQIFITETAQPSIEVAAGVNAELQVLQPSAPATIEVSVPGPQGPLFPKMLKIDSSVSNTIYVGLAEYDTAEADPAWIITRTTYNTAGVRTAKGVANNVTWTGRAGHTYV